MQLKTAASGSAFALIVLGASTAGAVGRWATSVKSTTSHTASYVCTATDGTGNCTSGYWTGGYIHPAWGSIYKGDLLFFDDANTSPTNQAQQLVFGSTITHVAICGGWDGVNCTWLLHNTAVFHDDNYSKGCNGFRDGAAIFTRLTPGTGWEVPGIPEHMTTASGYTFNPSGWNGSQSWQDYFANIASSGPGPSILYGINGYSHYHAYSMCSEYASDKLGLWKDEGGKATYVPQSQVDSARNTLWPQIRSMCVNQVGGFRQFGAWAFCGGIGAVCDDVADQAINAFLDRASYNDDNSARNVVVDPIGNLTAPATLYNRLSGYADSHYCATFRDKSTACANPCSPSDGCGGNYTTCGTCSSGGGTGTVSHSNTNTSTDTVNYTSKYISISAGTAFSAGHCLPGGSASGDTYLRLFLAGTQVAADDDSCGNLSSKITFTASTTGVYELRMGCYGSGTCSGTVGWSGGQGM